MVGGVLIIDKFLMLSIDICNVLGIGVVVKVKILIFVFNFFNFFLCFILNCCFLLIIINFKFENIIFWERSWCVLIIILIWFLDNFFSVFVCFFLLWKWLSILIVIG